LTQFVADANEKILGRMFANPIRPLKPEFKLESTDKARQMCQMEFVIKT
jgi:hypothetical protein